MMLDLCLPESWGNECVAMALTMDATLRNQPARASALGTTLVKTNGVFYGVPGPVNTKVALRRQNDKPMH